MHMQPEPVHSKYLLSPPGTLEDSTSIKAGASCPEAAAIGDLDEAPCVSRGVTRGASVVSKALLGDIEGGGDAGATGGANAVALGESGRLSTGNLGDLLGEFTLGRIACPVVSTSQAVSLGDTGGDDMGEVDGDDLGDVDCDLAIIRHPVDSTIHGVTVRSIRKLTPPNNVSKRSSVSRRLSTPMPV